MNISDQCPDCGEPAEHLVTRTDRAYCACAACGAITDEGDDVWAEWERGVRYWQVAS